MALSQTVANSSEFQVGEAHGFVEPDFCLLESLRGTRVRGPRAEDLAFPCRAWARSTGRSRLLTEPEFFEVEGFGQVVIRRPELKRSPCSFCASRAVIIGWRSGRCGRPASSLAASDIPLLGTSGRAGIRSGNWSAMARLPLDAVRRIPRGNPVFGARSSFRMSLSSRSARMQGLGGNGGLGVACIWKRLQIRFDR